MTVDWLLVLNISRVIFAVIILGWCSVLDIRTREVPNKYWLILGLGGIVLIECQIIIELGYDSFIHLLAIIPVITLFLSFLTCDYIYDLEMHKFNEPWVFMVVLSGFVFGYLFLTGPWGELGSAEYNNVLFVIILFMLYFIFVQVVLNYRDFHIYKKLKIKLEKQRSKLNPKNNDQDTEENKINKSTEERSKNNTIPTKLDMISERYSWTLFFGLLGFAILSFLMIAFMPVKIGQILGLLLLIVIPIVLVFYYIKYNLNLTHKDIEEHEHAHDHELDIDQLITETNFQPPSGVLVWILFSMLILFGFIVIIYISILEAISNLIAQILILMIWILIFYGFYNLGIPRGGADTKALMALVIVFPSYPIIKYLTFRTPFFDLVDDVPVTEQLFPFAFTILINGAFVMLFFIISMFLYNLKQKNLKFPNSLLGYKLPLNQVPKKFVWLLETIQDGKPKFQAFPDEELDLKLELDKFEKLGKSKVWVTPKIPFIIPMLVGLILAVILGNIIFLLIYSLA